MKNDEIKYQLSTDYERLYDLLKQGNKVVGFIADGYADPKPDRSKVLTMSYRAEGGYFDVDADFFEDSFTKEEILDYMAKWNVRYFDLPESQTETLPDVEEKTTDEATKATEAIKTLLDAIQFMETEHNANYVITTQDINLLKSALQ